MADFVEENDANVENQKLSGDEIPTETNVTDHLIDFANPQVVQYCPTCTMPPEFCEFGASFEKCAPWILQNCQEVLSPNVLSELLGKASLDDPEDADGEDKKKKKKGGGAAALKKPTVYVTKVVIAKVQRQKRKYVTVVGGLETVPDLKIKDAAKVFGKKFSSGASINELQTGQKEVVIQGDLSFDLPPLLMSEFKIAPTSIFFLEDNGQLRCYA